MAGTGASHVLDKSFAVVSTYNGSSVDGVKKFRCVAISSTAGPTYGTIDLNATGLAVGVVQDDIDRTKVATGKAVANVRLLGITKVHSADGTPVLGARVKAGGTAGNTGGVVAAAAATDKVLGIVVGAPTTVTAGDILEVLLTPGGLSN